MRCTALGTGGAGKTDACVHYRGLNHANMSERWLAAVGFTSPAVWGADVYVFLGLDYL